MCGFGAFTCGAIPFLLFTLRVFCSALRFRPSVRVVLCPASVLPEFRSALFLLRPLARHLMPVVLFGGIFAAVFLNVHCAGYYPAFFFCSPQTTIRLPSVSSSFRHPSTSRRCTGELVPFRIMLGSLACSFFAVLSVHFSRILARALCCSFRLFILGSFRAMPSPALSFFIKKFAYSNYFLYLCTRNEVRIDPK